jgi:alkaline phosphatase D
LPTSKAKLPGCGPKKNSSSSAGLRAARRHGDAIVGSGRPEEQAERTGAGGEVASRFPVGLVADAIEAAADLQRDVRPRHLLVRKCGERLLVDRGSQPLRRLHRTPDRTGFAHRRSPTRPARRAEFDYDPGRMPPSRRAFLRSAAASAMAWPYVLRAQDSALAPRLFQQGVASGDPLGDRVILWTRITAPPTRSAIGPIEVSWQVADDEQLTKVVARGTAAAAPDRDFTVKVDAAGLRPGRTYYYGFDAGGERSPIGRTRTLPAAGASRVRLAVASCSNYPAGYFNAYRGIANHVDLDAVLHLGDYIYEFAEGVYGDSKSIGRRPLPAGEAVTLADYRLRYAIYRSDPDLQEAHRLHPWVVVWDDHEIANDAWSGGAAGHTPKQGGWAARLAAAYRAYVEWLPVREGMEGSRRLYRTFRIGNLADLVMLDTRSLRDRQAVGATASALTDPARSLLGAAQETWLFDRLRASQRDGIVWRLVGQQVLFAQLTPTGQPLNSDMWDGYPAARARVLDFLAQEQVADVAILSGDLHSAWANDLPANPYAPADSPAARSLAVEILTPAVSSPPLFTDATLRARAPLLRQFAPHIKHLDGDGNGYVLLDVTRERLQADFYVVSTVKDRVDGESKAASFVCERGSSQLVAT